MQSNLNVIKLMLEASLPVQLIMLLLVGMFIYCSYLIWQKWILLKFAKRDLDEFEELFWSGADISEVYLSAQQKEDERLGLEAVFFSGFQEFLRLKQQLGHDEKLVVANVLRSMNVTLSKETDELESGLSWLATAGSVSPYLGLFGTVIGVMNSFISLGSVKQVTLNQVAPGIAEALIATAMGLMVAIPAVIFYNRFTMNIEKIVLRYENFIDEFSNILARQYHQLKLKK